MLQCIFKAFLHISYIQYVKTMIRMAKKQLLSPYLGHSALYTKIICQRFCYAGNTMKCENGDCFPRLVAKIVRNGANVLAWFCSYLHWGKSKVTPLKSTKGKLAKAQQTKLSGLVSSGCTSEHSNTVRCFSSN